MHLKHLKIQLYIQLICSFYIYKYIFIYEIEFSQIYTLMLCKHVFQQVISLPVSFPFTWMWWFVILGIGRGIGLTINIRKLQLLNTFTICRNVMKFGVSCQNHRTFVWQDNYKTILIKNQYEIFNVSNYPGLTIHPA